MRRRLTLRPGSTLPSEIDTTSLLQQESERVKEFLHRALERCFPQKRLGEEIGHGTRPFVVGTRSGGGLIRGRLSCPVADERFHQ